MAATNHPGVHGRAFLDLEANGIYVRRLGIDRSAGQADGYKIVMTNTEGKLDTTLMPDNRDTGTPALAVSALTAGDFVHLFFENGMRRAVASNAVNRERPPVAFVTESYQAGETAMVYTRGMNTRVSSLGFVQADVGRRVFLSYTAPGKTMNVGTLQTAWSASTVPMGAMIVCLGRLVEFAPTGMRVMFMPEPAVEIQARTSAVA